MRFVPTLTDLRATGSPAFALAPATGRVSDDRPALVYLDRSLSSLERRWSYAHEIGHVLCGHASSVPTLRVSEELHDRNEREAWEAAAVLLVPIEAFVEGQTVDGMAALCEVPPWLVQLYPR